MPIPGQFTERRTAFRLRLRRGCCLKSPSGEPRGNEAVRKEGISRLHPMLDSKSMRFGGQRNGLILRLLWSPALPRTFSGNSRPGDSDPRVSAEGQPPLMICKYLGGKGIWVRFQEKDFSIDKQMEAYYYQ